MTDKIVEVAAGILQRSDGCFLLAQRPFGKVCAGYWEFPGGKLEAGESPAEALHRELNEELGIQSLQSYPWITRNYSYPHAMVKLHFLRVMKWLGDPVSKESQIFSWQRPGATKVSPLLPANGPILKALELPDRYAISNASKIGEAGFLDCLKRALYSGLRLIQIREPTFDQSRLRHFSREVIALSREHGARVLVNRDCEFAVDVCADGVHLSSSQLMRINCRPNLPLCAASCHNLVELQQAARLGLDFAVLGPVNATQSHPEAKPLGWKRFAAVARDSSIPVYALGGLVSADLKTAWAAGAHGVAMMRGAW